MSDDDKSVVESAMKHAPSDDADSKAQNTEASQSTADAETPQSDAVDKAVPVTGVAAEKAMSAATDDKPATAAKPTTAKPAAGAAAERPARPARPAKAPAPPDPRVEAAKAAAEKIKETITQILGEGVVEEAGNAHFNPMLRIRKQEWLQAVELLRSHPDFLFNYIECMVGTDYKDYIEVVIYVQSTTHGQFICLKTRTDREAAEVPSLVSSHPGVNWEEREIYDLLGVTFTGHPDLRRIMLQDDFKGHPLRKDYSEWD